MRFKLAARGAALLTSTLKTGLLELPWGVLLITEAHNRASNRACGLMTFEAVMMSGAPGEHKHGICINFVDTWNLTNLESVPSARVFLGPRQGVGISGLARQDRAAARPLPAAQGRGGRANTKTQGWNHRRCKG